MIKLRINFLHCVQPMNAIATRISDDDGRCVMLVGCPGLMFKR